MSDVEKIMELFPSADREIVKSLLAETQDINIVIDRLSNQDPTAVWRSAKKPKKTSNEQPRMRISHPRRPQQQKKQEEEEKKPKKGPVFTQVTNYVGWGQLDLNKRPVPEPAAKPAPAPAPAPEPTPEPEPVPVPEPTPEPAVEVFVVEEQQAEEVAPEPEAVPAPEKRPTVNRPHRPILYLPSRIAAKPLDLTSFGIFAGPIPEPVQQAPVTPLPVAEEEAPKKAEAPNKRDAPKKAEAPKKVEAGSDAQYQDYPAQYQPGAPYNNFPPGGCFFYLPPGAQMPPYAQGMPPQGMPPQAAYYPYPPQGFPGYQMPPNPAEQRQRSN